MRWLALFPLLALTACPHDVMVRWPEAPIAPEAGATLELRFTDTVSHAQVSVNGRLMVSGERTNVVVISGIPAGNTSVVVAAEGMPMEKAFAVDLQPGQHVVVPLIAPPSQPFFGMVAQAFIGAVVFLGYEAIRSAL